MAVQSADAQRYAATSRVDQDGGLGWRIALEAQVSVAGFVNRLPVLHQIGKPIELRARLAIKLVDRNSPAQFPSKDQDGGESRKGSSIER